MESLSKEELLLVKEKFPDTFINEFYGEYFSNDNLMPIQNEEIISQYVLKTKVNNQKKDINIKENIHSLRNQRELNSQMNKENLQEIKAINYNLKSRVSQYNNYKNESVAQTDFINKDELFLFKEKFPDAFINKFYDEYFPTNVLPSMKITQDEYFPNNGLRQRINNLIKDNNLKANINSMKNQCEINNKQQDSNQTNSYNMKLNISPLTSIENNDYSILPHNISKNFLSDLSETVSNYQNYALNQSRNCKTRNMINFKNKKSVKMTVPSSKRQILEEEFRKEKYPSNEKLQKMSIKLNMRYDEVQNYFKKRRREEKETNNKFSNLVKLLDNYLEQED